MSQPKPVRGIENLDPNKQYFKIKALNPGFMRIGDPFGITGKPFIPEELEELGDIECLFVWVCGGRFPDDMISLRDSFVVGEEPYNNHRLFEYAPEAYALLKDIVARRAFEEYRELIGSTYPAR